MMSLTGSPFNDQSLKVTRHLCFKNRKNLGPLGILACGSTNKPSFQQMLL